MNHFLKPDISFQIDFLSRAPLVLLILVRRKNPLPGNLQRYFSTVFIKSVADLVHSKTLQLTEFN